MTPTVTSIRDQVVPILRDRGILRAGIFGSYAKGEEEPGSDLDLLVELPAGSTLFDLVGLQLDLADRLGIEVDAHADSDEADPPSPREVAHLFRGSGPPIPRHVAHPPERSDAGGLSHADTVLFEGGLAFFLRMEAPLRWMVWA